MSVWLICVLGCSPCIYSIRYPLCFLYLSEWFPSHIRAVLGLYLFKFLLQSFLSPLSGIPITWMLVNLMLSQHSLRLSSFFSFFFLYSVPHQWFTPVCLPSCLFVLLLPVLCYCFLLVEFFILVIVFCIFACLIFKPISLFL